MYSTPFHSSLCFNSAPPRCSSSSQSAFLGHSFQGFSITSCISQLVAPINSCSLSLLAAADCRLTTPSCTHEKLSDNHTGFFFQAEDTPWNCMVPTPANTSLSDENKCWGYKLFQWHSQPLTDIFLLLEQNNNPSPWYKNIPPLLQSLISQITILNSKPQPANEAEA